MRRREGQKTPEICTVEQKLQVEKVVIGAVNDVAWRGAEGDLVEVLVLGAQVPNARHYAHLPRLQGECGFAAKSAMRFVLRHASGGCEQAATGMPGRKTAAQVGMQRIPRSSRARVWGHIDTLAHLALPQKNGNAAAGGKQSRRDIRLAFGRPVYMTAAALRFPPRAAGPPPPCPRRRLRKKKDCGVWCY